MTRLIYSLKFNMAGKIMKVSGQFMNPPAIVVGERKVPWPNYHSYVPSFVRQIHVSECVTLTVVLVSFSDWMV